MNIREAQRHIDAGRKVILERGIYGTFNVERIEILDARTRKGIKQVKFPAFMDKTTGRRYKSAWFDLRPDMDALTLQV